MRRLSTLLHAASSRRFAVRVLPVASLLALTTFVLGADSPQVADSTAAEMAKIRHEVQRPADDSADPYETGGPPDLTILSTTDVNGETAPCGCAHNPRGGLSRRASVIDTTRQSTSRVVLVDAGDFTGPLEATGAPRGLFLVEMAKTLGYDAITVGDGDARLGLTILRNLAADRDINTVSANLVDHATGKLLFAPSTILVKSGVKVGITAVTPPTDTEGGELAKIGVDANDAMKALGNVLPDLRKKCDIVVVLARMPLVQARLIGDTYPDLADVIVVGSDVVGRGIVHREQGGAIYLTAGNRGYALGRVRMRLDGHKKPKDVVGDEIVLTTDVGENQSILSLVEKFRDNLNEILKDDAVRKTEAHQAPDGSYYVGVMKCADCHAREYEIWTKTKHAHAFQTLTDVKSDALPECYRCHTTGATETGGYMPGSVDAASLQNVQCEVCHGKGSHHARDGSWGQGLLHDACKMCHDPVNSPDFEHDKYWARIEH